MYFCAVIYQPTFLFISGAEIAFILFIVIMVFGADKLPEIARGLGKGMRTLKDATNDIKHEITKSAENHGIDTSITKDVKKELDKVKDDIDDFTGSVKRKF
ncbi:twin-arginine translocase TatA/TatE family subunit [Seonamhaeicola sp.]|uniref:Sec-independent protein translocase subunit TatA/TatB n=1 Tax=Seonamhaeicola sp. TaxID=1912245 RepID=UPI00261E581D|nr:twin-arginine translocase TatA/TatE family subunit [Seonamhaeicola sp.]